MSTVGPCPCPADFNGDGHVFIQDLFVLFGAWGSDPGGPPDVDGDGVVGFLDLLVMFSTWGNCARN